MSGVTVKDSEVESFFNSNKERFVSPRGVAISAIFTDPRDSAGRYQDDAKSELDAKAKIDGIYQQLRTGADFADVARRRSEDDTLVRGGDMGFWDEARLKQAGIPQEIVSALFGELKFSHRYIVGTFQTPASFVRFARARIRSVVTARKISPGLTVSVGEAMRAFIASSTAANR